MLNRVMFIFVVIIFLIAGVFATDKYVVDVSHTNIGFSVKHMVITNVQGEFKDFELTFIFNEEDLANSSINATIKTCVL